MESKSCWEQKRESFRLSCFRLFCFVLFCFLLYLVVVLLCFQFFSLLVVLCCNKSQENRHKEIETYSSPPIIISWFDNKNCLAKPLLLFLNEFSFRCTKEEKSNLSSSFLSTQNLCNKILYSFQ